ncbi:MAG: sec-independent protein translocase protein TatB [Micromonosporaceae bacterium]|jgi:sec-independent protein translocase protein TatB|nr:sec-independent protein translocase protein TatB [Micromonosporaceae bacterium]
MGLDNIGAPELIVIVLIGLFIFGPDKLPKAISDGVRMLRQLREMARNATGDLSRELGTDFQLEDLNPRTFLRKHVLSEDDEAAIRRPLQSVVDDLRGTADQLKGDLTSTASALDIHQPVGPAPTQGEAAATGSPPAVRQHTYDDAT